jgi:hypothetical protein
VGILHPDRVLSRDIELTKLDLAACYAGIADWMVPLVADRRLTVVQCTTSTAAPADPRADQGWRVRGATTGERNSACRVLRFVRWIRCTLHA